MEEQQKKKKPIYKKWWFWLIIALLVCSVAFGSGEDTEQPEANNSGDATSSTVAETTPQDTTVPETTEGITFTQVAADDMVTLLEDNALKAQQTYKSQYVEITGKLSNIDSNGDYISLDPLHADFNFVNIQCFLQNEEQVAIVADLSRDDVITVRGEVTSVGEVLGYSVDTIEIIPDQGN